MYTAEACVMHDAQTTASLATCRLCTVARRARPPTERVKAKQKPGRGTRWAAYMYISMRISNDRNTCMCSRTLPPRRGTPVGHGAPARTSVRCACLCGVWALPRLAPARHREREKSRARLLLATIRGRPWAQKRRLLCLGDAAPPHSSWSACE